MTKEKVNNLESLFDNDLTPPTPKAEIYIDGVNVAGCNDYREVEYKEMPICMNYYNHLPKPPKETEFQYCAGNKNCHYKQLKRLEQENKELKEIKEQLKKWNDENLKRQDDMQLWIDLAEEQRRKYRSALEEINLILDELKQQYDYMTDYSEIKEIQNKINEVLQ